MQNFIHKFKLILGDKSLRNKILFVLFAFLVFRAVASIPIPGIDTVRLASLLEGNQFLGFLNIFSGGGLSSLSIIMLGVSPYITGSIVMQLLTVMVPKLKALYHEEGEVGRKKFTQYSRLLTVPLAALQGYALLMLLQRQGVISFTGGFDLFYNIILVVAGSIFLMWLGELISEFGIGNGVSMIIFGGIVASLPGTIGQLAYTFDPSLIPMYLGFVVAGILMIALIVTVNEAERAIPVTYAKVIRGGKTHGGVSTFIPLKLNQAGVMPIIFALSILLFPQLIGNFLAGAGNATLLSISSALIAFSQSTVLYSVVYFVLVFLFTYFYTAVTFDPKALSENLQKSGAFIPGIRPGLSTEEYVGKIVGRITFIGASFLGLVAVLPLVVRELTGIQAIALGGTALLIVVNVVIDLLKKVDAQIAMREY
ncbi:MAG: preprotein translocase subunit SecY [Candidatus Pacebacteria bacterium]|nr:preprotein translocase subunit SecY [Candidatus Paceibacterota bacterium]MBP9058585.1 preprotein translocase subunit SecY [Candidatus Paceibacterota bacterium]MBP9769930.1 preprotein translocase subunit SecY [Candidatus Paceibacterota bacterium]